jgi:hypothetical protein
MIPFNYERSILNIRLGDSVGDFSTPKQFLVHFRSILIANPTIQLSSCFLKSVPGGLRIATLLLS